MEILRGILPDSAFEQCIDFDRMIGKGTTRDVFAVFGRDDVVIKKQNNDFPLSNFVEWIVWNAVLKMREDIMGTTPNPDLQERFAECYSISHSARYLMMEKLSKIEDPSAIKLTDFPSWLNDKKPSAFGRCVKNNVKAMDYGLVNFYEVLNPRNSPGSYPF